MLAPIPYPHPDQLVMVWSRIQDDRNSISAGDFVEWQRQSTSFQALSAWTGRVVILSEGERPEQVGAVVATPGFLRVVGFPLLVGRDFRLEEGMPGADRVVVLTHGFWQERFNGVPSIVGRAIRIDGQSHTVIGVLAPSVADRFESRIYLPLAFTPDQINHDFRWLSVIGRLKPGVTLPQANADMQAVAKRLAKTFPASNRGWDASVEPLQNNFISDNAQKALWLLLGAVGFVLLIACANVANLLLARGAARGREVAVRASLGATRRRLFSQFLTESVVLAGAGGLLGLALAAVLLDAIMALMPEYTLPPETDVRLNLPVLLFTLAASTISGVLFGCAPAWQVTRWNLNDVLKEAGRSAVGSGRSWVRRGLVVAEFALALTLLAGAGLAIHSVVKLTYVDLGFRTDHLLTYSLPVLQTRLPEAAQIDAFYRTLLERIGAIPGVTAVSASTGIPVRGTNFGMPFYIAGRPVADRSKGPRAGFNQVTPAHFRTFGIQIERGRAFTDQDTATSRRVAIVNDAFVRTYLRGLDPLQQRIVLEQLIPGVTRLGPAVEWQIVGVFKAVRNGGPRGDFPEIDVPFAQSPWPATFMAVRTAVDPASVIRSLSAVVQGLDPNLLITNVRTMDQLVHESLADDRFQAIMLGGFAVVALVLAALGIYGVMSFTVAQRTHEIGLRMALGAGRHQVLRQVLLEGTLTALTGVLIGSIGAYLVGRAMQGMLFGVGAIDPTAFGVTAGLLLLSAVLACLVPALRAASVDPMIALRQD